MKKDTKRSTEAGRLSCQTTFPKEKSIRIGGQKGKNHQKRKKERKKERKKLNLESLKGRKKDKGKEERQREGRKKERKLHTE